jgi:CelD/BcsL family acetyltransferase involved in cellulose biosynthesis
LLAETTGMTAVIISSYSAADADAASSRMEFAWAGFDVSVGVCARAIEAEWRELERRAVGSIFQSFDYVDVWSRTAAGPGEIPMIVTGRRDGMLAFVLPMAIVRRHGVRVLTWLAQGCANYGMALVEAQAFDAIDAPTVQQLLKLVARVGKAHAVHLEAQPLRWGGRDNPFAQGPHARLDANDTFVLPLEEDFSAQYTRLFATSSRSRLKRKQRKLLQNFQVSYARITDRAQRNSMLNWFLEKKRQRLGEKGRPNVFENQTVQKLLFTLAGNTADFDIDALSADGEPLSLAMTIRAGETAFMINTAHVGAQFSGYSPGSLLLHWLVAALHERGIRVLDFGPGDLAYKRDWRPQVIPLMVTSFSVSPLGLPVSAGLALKAAIKRKVKRNERLLAIAVKINRGLDRLQGRCP